ncbi:MAG TPA: PEGA domain-containing protein [Pyrinomonadaceae bacterium]|nr:PEGA domain-containing protein [Pyrinomonadaceae bacterium]
MNVLKRIPLCLVLSLTLQSVAHTQEKKPKEKDKTTATRTEAPPTTPATPRPPLAFGLAEDTPVRLKLTRTMSSQDAKVDEKVDFEVVEDVKIGDVVVIQHGGMAIATVTEAKPKARMGKAGKLNMNIDYVQLVSGEKVPLRAVKGGSGGNHTGAMTGAIVATSILFFPAAPFFLFMHGKDITIPKGTEITAYVAGDTPLEPSKFKTSALVESTASKPDVSGPNLSPIAIKSTPDGAEITIDDKLVGTTPSTVQVTPGDHTIVIGKAGFKPWQRTITVTTGGTINLEATLDKVP